MLVEDLLILKAHAQPEREADDEALLVGQASLGGESQALAEEQNQQHQHVGTDHGVRHRL